MDPLMISATIQAISMKACTVLVLLKAHQNTLRNSRKSDLLHHNDVITKTMEKFGPLRNKTNDISIER